MTRRIFPMADWATAQEAIFDGPSSSAAPARPTDDDNNNRPNPSSERLPTMRGKSLTLPWRNRPKSLVLSGDEDASSSRFQSFELGVEAREQITSAYHNTHHHHHHHQHQHQHYHQHRRQDGHTYSLTNDTAVQRPDSASTALRGIFRRASTTIKGKLNNHRRASLVSAGMGPAGPATSPITEEDASSSPSPSPSRPGTSHTAWHRLRQAASFRQPRSSPYLFHGPESGGGGATAAESGQTQPAELSTSDMAAAVPSIGGEPPIIPRNTGAAAKAAVALQNEYLLMSSSTTGPSSSSQAASQSQSQRRLSHVSGASGMSQDGGGSSSSNTHGHAATTTTTTTSTHGGFQNKWLMGAGGNTSPVGVGSSSSTDDFANDHESGIGITVASSVAESKRASLQEDQDASISRIDFVSELPSELAIQILMHLDAMGLATASRVSKSWRVACSTQHIWRESFMREKTATYATSGPIQPGMGLGIPAIRPSNDWKEIYRVKTELDRRWKRGEGRPTYLHGHQDSIYCLQFDEHKIITGSRDRTIRIWDMHTFECRLIIGPPEVLNDVNMLVDENLKPVHYATDSSNKCVAHSVPALVSFPTHHKASILCLQYDDGMLVTGSSDASCIVYNARSGYRPVRRLTHHSGSVLDLTFDERHIVTCSKDVSICVWDRQTGALLRQLRGHQGPVNAVQMRGNTIVSCSGDFKVKLWNIDTGKNIREFAGHTKGLACSQFSEDGRYIASAGNDKSIRVWDANTGECLQDIRAHDGLVRSLHIDSVSGRLVSASYDTDLKVFDMRTGVQLLDLPKWHQSWVLSAKSDYRRIVSTGQDPKILCMDFGADIPGIEVLESGRGGRGGDGQDVAEGGYI